MAPRTHGRLLPALFSLLILCMGFVPAVSAQNPSPTLLLRPHCEELDQLACANYDVKDPMTLITPSLKPGDTLDMDLVLFNPNRDPVKSIRVWLTYDSTLLEGKTVTVNPLFPLAIPGEVEFSPMSGYIKAAASADAGKEPSDVVLPLARIVLTVKTTAGENLSPIGFHDLKPGTDSHTFVATTAAAEQNMINPPLGSLIVQTGAPAGGAASSAGTSSSSTHQSSSSAPRSSVSSSSSISSSSSMSSKSSSSSISSSSSSVTSASSATSSVAAVSSSSTPSSTSFSLLQVQNVRIGTKGSDLYVTWDVLSHPKLQGYNIYYGTAPGSYLQRRSVSVAARGAVIRDLAPGKTYYAAVSGMDDENRESAFSSEVSVEIGNPGTSSSPIIGDIDAIGEEDPGSVAPENPLEDPEIPLEDGVPGDTGSPSALLLLLLGSAAIGTLFAVRRQVIAVHNIR